jgi:hypothetical protein
MLEDLCEVVQACADTRSCLPLSDTELALRLFIKRHAAQIEQDAKDAARYRWLKINATELTGEYGEAAQLYYGTYRSGPLQLDASIDAAMAKESKV